MVNYTEESAFIEKYKPFRKFWTVFSPHFVARLHSLANMIRGKIQLKNHLLIMRIFLQSMKLASKIGKTHRKLYRLKLFFG